MEVSSPLTGKRGVSLPFTDFCTPLKPAERNGRQLYDAALELGNERGWRYLECRSNDHEWSGSSPSLGFYGHVVELRHGPDALLKGFESSVRRGIRKAQLAGLRVEFSKSADAMRAFCALHARTRHRHGLPPQPHRFFESIVQHVFGQNQGFVVTARQGERPIAAAVFFHDARLAIYKFGASDERFQEFRPNNLVMWEAIKWFAGRGYGTLHLGRTSLANEGLRRFKLGFNAREERIEYYRYDFTKRAFVSAADRAEGWANSIFRCLPAPLLRLAGTLLYPHLS